MVLIVCVFVCGVFSVWGGSSVLGGRGGHVGLVCVCVCVCVRVHASKIVVIGRVVVLFR